MNLAVAYPTERVGYPVLSVHKRQLYWVFKVIDNSSHLRSIRWGELMPYPEYPTPAIAEQFLSQSHNHDPGLRFVCMGGPVDYSEAMQLIHLYIGE